MSENPNKPVAFVSSTYLDNVERRSSVREAIERAGMVPIAMERWSADARTPHELCMHRVQEADVFVGILAWRYGWIPEGHEKSITELEYEKAVSLGLPRFMFLIHQPLREVNVETEFDRDDPWRKQQLLVEFKRRCEGEQTAAPFTDGELKTLVLQALFEWKERRTETADGSGPDELAYLVRSEQTLAEYLRTVEADHASVTLPGFSTRLRVPLSLEDLYVPIDLAHSEQPEESAIKGHRWKLEPGEDNEQLSLPLALRHLATDPRRRGLLLLGHPGSGKTTQLRRLALTLAREGPAILKLDDELVPVLVPLRKLNAEDSSLAGLAQRLVADENRDFTPEFAKWLWKRGKLLLLVDGLDEVARDRRGEVGEWIEKVANGRKGNLVVVTCRFEGYTRDLYFGPEFLGFSLRPLSNEQADRFVERWYHQVETGLLPPGSAERERKAAAIEAQRRARELVARLHDPSVRASRVYELAHNPLLLTAICLVHRDRAKLPDRAAELYRDTIDVLLQHWREAKQLPVSFEARPARRILQPVALWLHEVEGRTQACEEDLCEIMGPAMAAARWQELSPSAFLSTVRDESGLLTGWSAERFGFLHLAFQEYLAAAELCRRARAQAGDAEGFEAEVQSIVDRFGSSWWREVLSLVFAVDEEGSLFAPLFRAILRRGDLVEHAEIARQCAADAACFDPLPFRELLRAPAGEGRWRNRLVAVEILRAQGDDKVSEAELAPCIEILERPAGRSRALREEQLAALELLARIAPREARAVASTLLEHPGESLRELARTLAGPSPATELRTRGGPAEIPPAVAEESSWTEQRSGCELALIPGGRFLMGSPQGEDGRDDDEGPQHEVELEQFYLAVHPVTNEQYARFLEATSEVGEPAHWADRKFNQPRQPVVGVSWDDAQSFCKWAGLLLPTEAQWEYACRAGATTRYWSGDGQDDLARVGWYAENSGRRLHPVGEKPANPFGLLDLHGNVWEWCADWFGPYSNKVRAGDGLRDVHGAGGRVSRGGSFDYPARDARSAYRNGAAPGYRRRLLGFRPAQGITSG